MEAEIGRDQDGASDQPLNPVISASTAMADTSPSTSGVKAKFTRNDFMLAPQKYQRLLYLLASEPGYENVCRCVHRQSNFVLQPAAVSSFLAWSTYICDDPPYRTLGIPR